MHELIGNVAFHNVFHWVLQLQLNVLVKEKRISILEVLFTNVFSYSSIQILEWEKSLSQFQWNYTFQRSLVSHLCDTINILGSWSPKHRLNCSQFSGFDLVMEIDDWDTYDNFGNRWMKWINHVVITLADQWSMWPEEKITVG